MRFRYLVAATLLIAAFVPASAQSVKAGIEAWQRGDYAAAAAIWRPLAEKGDADAAFNLGQAYRLGRGMPTNLGAAQIWLERAARQGHLDAETTLGLLLFETGNQSGGLRWLKNAANKGEPRASLIYGTALFNGDNVSRDPLLGYAYVSRAAAQGLGPAKTTLAELDRILPLAERQKAVALAINMAKESPPPGSKASPKKSAPSKPAPSAAQARAKAKPTPPAPAAVGSGPWRIQLGAFSQRSSAETLFTKLSGRSALAGRRAFYVDAGNVTRLHVGPYASRSAAQAACAALKPQPCFPVAVGKVN